MTHTETPTQAKKTNWALRLLPVAIVIVGLVAAYMAGLHKYLSLETLETQRAALNEFVTENFVLAFAALAASDLDAAAAGDCDRSMTCRCSSSSDSDERPVWDTFVGVLNGSLVDEAAAFESDFILDWRRSLILRRIFSWRDSLCRAFTEAAAVIQISARRVRTLYQYLTAPEGLARKGLLNQELFLFG